MVIQILKKASITQSLKKARIHIIRNKFGSRCSRSRVSRGFKQDCSEMTRASYWGYLSNLNVEPDILHVVYLEALKPFFRLWGLLQAVDDHDIDDEWSIIQALDDHDIDDEWSILQALDDHDIVDEWSLLQAVGDNCIDDEWRILRSMEPSSGFCFFLPNF